MVELALLLFQGPGPAPPAPLPMPPINVPSQLLQQFQGVIPRWFGAVQPVALDVFYVLMGLEFAWLGVEILQRRRMTGGLEGIVFSLTEKILACGFWLCFVTLAGNWIPAIFNSFIAIGKAGTAMPALGPSIILGQGFTIAGNLFGAAMNLGWLNVLSTTGIGLMIAAFFIIVAFLALTVLLVTSLVQSFLGIGAGMIFLAFGGSQWTRPYAEKYVSYCVAVGTKIMMIYFLVGAGWQLSNAWIQMAQNVPQTWAGVLVGWYIACGALLYFTVVWSGGSFISNIMGGTTLSHRDVLGVIGSGVSAGVSAGMIASGITGATGAAGKTGASAASGGAVTTPVAASSAPSASARVPVSTPNGRRN
jgi:type IV secretion system protein TrbL